MERGLLYTKAALTKSHQAGLASVGEGVNREGVMEPVAIGGCERDELRRERISAARVYSPSPAGVFRNSPTPTVSPAEVTDTVPMVTAKRSVW